MERSGWRFGAQIAAAVRQELGLGDQPLNIWHVIRDRGVAVARPDFGEDGPDGLYTWKRGEDGPGLITVNRAKNPGKQVFTAAHELGHHEIHRDGAGGLIADVDVFSNGDVREKEANAFAAYLLAPDAGVRRVAGELRNELVTPETVAEIAAHFGISYETALYRLNNAGVIRKVDLEQLKDGGGYSVAYLLEGAGANAEAFPGPSSTLPTELEAGALDLYRRAVITVERLADLLQIDVDAARRLVEERGMQRQDPEPDEDAVLALLSGE